MQSLFRAESLRREARRDLCRSEALGDGHPGRNLRATGNQRAQNLALRDVRRETILSGAYGNILAAQLRQGAEGQDVADNALAGELSRDVVKGRASLDDHLNR